jgi:hypothetical protein
MSTPPFLNFKADSGATAHFHQMTPHLHHHPISTSNPAVHVIVPNGNIMTSTATAQLPLPSLTAASTKSHAFPTLASGSLLSVGQICDNACTAVFNSSSVRMYHNQDVTITPARPPFLTGTGNMPFEPLYNIRIPTTLPPLQGHACNALTSKLPHLQDRIAFYHASLFSPVLPTWTYAMNEGFLDSFPALTTKQVTQYAPRSKATSLGHMHAQRSNIKSTKPTAPPVPMPAPSKCTNIIYTDCRSITGNIGSDQTGRFVVPSTSGNNYLFILFDYDSNSIHAEPIPNRKKKSIKAAYEKKLCLLQRHGLHPKLH